MPFDIGGFVYNTAFIQDYTKGGIVTDGLVLHLDAAYGNSYPKGGTTWYDLSGNGYNGTLTNGPTYNSGNGGSIVFDGSNDYITLPQNSINTNSNFTLSFWAKRNNSSNATLISGLLPTGHFQLRYSSTSNIDILESFIVNIGTYSNVTTINNIENIVMVRTSQEGMLVIDTYTLYVNGSNVGAITSDTLFSTQNPVLGLNYNAAGLNGSIYTFMYYNRALSSTEVAINYNAQKGRFGL